MKIYAHKRIIFLCILVLITYLNHSFAQKPIKMANLVGRTIKSNLKYRLVFQHSRFANPLMDSILRSTKELDWETSFTEAGSDQIEMSSRLKRAQLSLDNNPPFFDTNNPNSLPGVLASNADHYRTTIKHTYLKVFPRSEGTNSSSSKQMTYLTNIKDFDTLNLASSILFFSDLPPNCIKGTSWTDSSSTELYHSKTTFFVQSISDEVIVLNFKYIVSSKDDLSSEPLKDKNRNVDLHSEIRVNERHSTAEGVVYIDLNNYLIKTFKASISRQIQSSINGVRDKDDTALSEFYLQHIIE